MLLRSQQISLMTALLAAIVAVGGPGASPTRSGDGQTPEPAAPLPIPIKLRGSFRFATFSPSGSFLACGGAFVDPAEEKGGEAVALIDVASGKVVWRQDSGAKGWVPAAGVFSPDGKSLAVGSVVFDVERGKVARELEAPFGNAMPLAYSADGKRLAGLTRPYKPEHEEQRKLGEQWVICWDAVTGKEIHTFNIHQGGFSDRAQTRRKWPRALLEGLTLSQDGKAVVTEHPVRDNPGLHQFRYNASIEGWDVATGQHLGGLRGENWTFYPYWYEPLQQVGLPLGQWSSGASSALGMYRAYSSPDGTVQVVPNYRRPPVAAAAALSKDGVIYLTNPDPAWPVLRPYWRESGGKGLPKELGRVEDFKGGRLTSVQVSPDGKTLAALGVREKEQTTTLLVWDVSRLIPEKAAPPELTAEQFQTLWSLLAGEVPLPSGEDEKEVPVDQRIRQAQHAYEPSKVHMALYKLYASPEQAVPFLAERLKVPDEGKRAAKLIEELNDPAFQTRERATADLQGLGAAALPAVEKALAGELELNARTRLKRVLEKVDTPEQRLRCWRALDLLEQISTPAARDVLKAVSERGPVRGASQAAKDALQRLEPSATPTR